MDYIPGNKLIIAVIKFDDYEDTAEKLTTSGFFMTLLSSTGGFLKKKNATIMIGVDEGSVDKVMEILRSTAGVRREKVYVGATSAEGHILPGSVASIPVERDAGGAVAFVMTLDHMEKF
ncbi:MAG: cyclic-di-AMP receptor [Oscillospiraceae bacterium]